MTLANDAFAAMCGHGALAAALGVPVLSAIQYFPQLADGKTWVNMPDMERALLLAKARFVIIGREWPDRGLVMIQWTGPWTKPGVPPRVACMHRHWIAVNGPLVWDANFEAWIKRAEWDAMVMEDLPPKADGWAVARGYRFLNS